MAAAEYTVWRDNLGTDIATSVQEQPPSSQRSAMHALLHMRSMKSPCLQMVTRTLVACLALVIHSANSNAQNSYDFVDAGTSDVLATMELRPFLQVSVEDMVAFSFSPEGDAIFGLGVGPLEPAFFSGGGSVADFGSIGLRSFNNEDVSWSQDFFTVGPGMVFQTYHFSLNFFPFSPPFLPDSLELTGDATASAIGRWLPTPVVSDPGDYNQDGEVDGTDYLAWQSSFGSTTNLAADGNGNGTIDSADYTIWRDNYGMRLPAAPASSSVPEPTSLGLVVLAATCVLCRSTRPLLKQ